MGTVLTITSEHVQARVAITVFRLKGWLDAQSENQFVQAAQAAYEAGARFLVLDLSQIEAVASAGIRAVQKANRIFASEGALYRVAHVRLASAPPQIVQVLGITGFLQNLPLYENVQAAIESFEA